MMKILVTRHIPGNYLDGYENFHIQFFPGEGDIREWILSNIEGADGILVTLNEKIDREIIDHATRLKVISTYSVGYDHIDVEYAKSRGITVTYTPEVLTEATADLIFGIMLAVARNIVSGDRLIRDNGWQSGWKPGFMLGSEVHGKTIGFIGMGRIGKAVLERSKGFDMKALYYSRSIHNVDADYVDLDYLLSESDFVVIALDLNSETFHFMNYERISRMKKSAFLINGTRGKVVDEGDLVRALENHIIRGAAVDVFENEPIDGKNPLASMENVVLTPHLGSATYETRDKMAETAAINLFNVLNGKKPLYKL
jgi:lactate dehydrogenase-like 2-hydroxyacid dehydrogenase